MSDEVDLYATEHDPDELWDLRSGDREFLDRMTKFVEGLIDARDMTVRPLRDALLDRLVRLEPYFRATGDEDHLVMLRDVCTRGNSSDRQRAEYVRNGQVEDVVRFNVREFEAGEPLWS